jgi:hypothetical protein
MIVAAVFPELAGAGENPDFANLDLFLGSL